MRGLLGAVQSVARVVMLIVMAPVMLVYLVVGLLLATLAGLFALGIFRGAVLGLDAFDDPATVLGWAGALVVYVACWSVAIWLWTEYTGIAARLRRGRGDSHGSARFADKKDLARMEGSTGLIVGRNPNTGRLLRYDGPAHLLTFAPTRSGKGVSSVLPNLLLVERSVLVIDPKGENARIAGAARGTFGDVFILDPFGATGMASASYNPLDRLSADSLDLGDDASSLADALVMDAAGQGGDSHWNEEAKALIGGLIMFCVAHEDAERRCLATVREYLTLSAENFTKLMELMQESTAAGGLIARAANRHLGKADREAASVLSTAQRHTHFLDSPRIISVTSRSDFHFAELRQRIASVFLVLPPNRLDAYARWLRLLVTQALQEIARDAEAAAGPQSTTAASTTPARGRTDFRTAPALLQARTEPSAALTASEGVADAQNIPYGAAMASQPRQGPTGDRRAPTAPTLFLLDEFAALGRLEAVERAMGLMAGYGLQLWPILQDMSQLKDLYGARANTFIANAGVQQVFGVNDFETAKWLSQTMGQATTGYQTQSMKLGEDPSTSHNLTGRDLLTPDEIMQMPSTVQLLRIQGQPPAVVQKLRYYADPEFAGLFVAQAA
ncbi:type IV secretion system protein VirD4 [Loktanella atrilutea]|uniref:Type IV secretion system protein VirD4 n=1 Tax=Loktanella atrilutea TaxID=366533 RepID=A0A1M5F1A0_LOKAT|nr:type IV secretory system conjugative DNA transfer family protein [Loktanella atrilutea]SHF85305.1 type IV secretion system protein VirD4 [Loktanella atrilutea]